jgi:hypothetical protein
MAWCETHRVDYVLGLAKNNRLKKAIEREMAQARQQHEATGEAARVFKDFRYRCAPWRAKRWNYAGLGIIRRSVLIAERLIDGVFCMPMRSHLNTSCGGPCSRNGLAQRVL